MVKKRYYKNEGLSWTWDCMRVYENNKSVQDCSNSNLHSCNTLLWLKKKAKKGYYNNESLGLAWDRMEVYKITQWNCIQ